MDNTKKVDCSDTLAQKNQQVSINNRKDKRKSFGEILIEKVDLLMPPRI